MGRIFSVLSVVALTLIVANLYLGLTGGDFNAAVAEYKAKQTEWESSASGRPTPEQEAEILEFGKMFKPIKQRATLHFLVGVLAALVAILVQSIGITYFIGTGRWCKEVVEAYDLEAEILEAGTKLKRRTFPWAMIGVATILTIACFGAACDPTRGGETAKWVPHHLFVGMGGTVLIAYCLLRQWQGINANQAVIDRLMQRVREERERRGLDVESDTATDNEAGQGTVGA